MKTPQHLNAGERFGRWVSLGQHKLNPVGYKGEKKRFELVRCDCGNRKRITRSDLRRGHSTSCGCYMQERARDANITHGDSKSIFYQRRAKAKQRCECETDKEYSLYGGRGIKFGRDNYDAFKKDMHHSYLEHSRIYGEHNTTLDRINPDGDYCKENCRRATISENCGENKRQSRKYRYGISAEEVSQKTGYKKESLYTILNRFGGDFNEMMKHLIKK